MFINILNRIAVSYIVIIYNSSYFADDMLTIRSRIIVRNQSTYSEYT